MPEKKLEVAVHEAGHAIVALFEGLQIGEISVWGRTAIYFLPEDALLDSTRKEPSKEEKFQNILKEFTQNWDLDDSDKINEVLAPFWKSNE